MAWKAAVFLPAVTGVQVHQPHVYDANVMKDTFLAFVAKGKIDDATIVAVTGFLKTIKEDLLGALEADRNHTQAVYDDAVDDVNECNRDRTTWFDNTTGTWANWNTDVSDKKDSHNSCRIQEDVTFWNFTEHCHTMHSRVCSWTVCELPASGFAGGDTDEVDTYIDCLFDFFDDHGVEYYTERNNCIDATNLHHAQTASCDTRQGEFEDEYCSREDSVQNRCKSYDGCRRISETSYLQIKVEIEDLEATYQAQFVALHHLLCYGNQILNNSTDLTGCEEVGKNCEADFTDCPAVTYTVPDAFINCGEPTENKFPCTATFLSEFYGHLDETVTPKDDCEVCTSNDVNTNAWGGDRKTQPDDADDATEPHVDPPVVPPPVAPVVVPPPVVPVVVPPPPTCSDSIMNQGEEGIDCGGPCPACPAVPLLPPSTVTQIRPPHDVPEENAAVCDWPMVVDLNDLNLVRNNLGEVGGAMRFDNVLTEVNFENTSLIITADSDYHNKGSGASLEGDIVKIGLQCNKAASFTMWLQKDGAIVQFPEVVLSIYDLDGGSDGLEKFSICGPAKSSKMVRKDPNFIKKEVTGNCTVLSNKRSGGSYDNPTSSSLTNGMAKRAADVLFTGPTALATFDFEVGSCNAGRNLMFALNPSVSCNIKR